MLSTIESSRHIRPEYRRWTQELMTVFGTGLTYDNGMGLRKRYPFRESVTRIRLLTENEFEMEQSKVGYAFLESGYEPAWDAYKALSDGEPVDFNEFFEGLEQVSLEMNPAFWRPLWRYDGVRPTLRFDYGSEIVVCPSRISSKASEIQDRIPEVEAGAVERLLFRVILTHEIGHHFTLVNFSSIDVMEILRSPDLNILEGLANWFVHAVLQREERWVLAETATNLSASRRHYLFFKHSDISALLDIFFSGFDYVKAPSSLGKIIGGKYNLNGGTAVIDTNFDLLAMDWSEKGGRIVAGEEIKALSTMRRGIFITPRIQLLIGRFPKEAIVVANKIQNVADYGELPDNIMVLPKDKADLFEIIRRHLADDDRTRIRSILDEAGLQSISDSPG